MSGSVVGVCELEKLVEFCRSLMGRFVAAAVTAGAVAAATVGAAFAASPNAQVLAGMTDAGDLAVQYLTAAIPVIISVLLVGLGIGIIIRVVHMLRSAI